MLIGGVLGNNTSLEPPPPASHLNSHYPDLLAKQELFLLLRKQPLIICVCKVGPKEKGSTTGWDGQGEGEETSAATPSLTNIFNSQGIALGTEMPHFPIHPLPRWKHLSRGGSAPPLLLPTEEDGGDVQQPSLLGKSKEILPIFPQILPQIVLVGTDLCVCSALSPG